jgi:hypothetical protein
LESKSGKIDLIWVGSLILVLISIIGLANIFLRTFTLR